MTARASAGPRAERKAPHCRLTVGTLGSSRRRSKTKGLQNRNLIYTRSKFRTIKKFDENLSRVRFPHALIVRASGLEKSARLWIQRLVPVKPRDWIRWQNLLTIKDLAAPDRIVAAERLHRQFESVGTNSPDQFCAARGI
jgi:hypothetical protein